MFQLCARSREMIPWLLCRLALYVWVPVHCPCSTCTFLYKEAMVGLVTLFQISLSKASCKAESPKTIEATQDASMGKPHAHEKSLRDLPGLARQTGNRLHGIRAVPGRVKQEKEMSLLVRTVLLAQAESIQGSGKGQQPSGQPKQKALAQ